MFVLHPLRCIVVQLASLGISAFLPFRTYSILQSELSAMVDTLEGHPSIVVWVPFNEAWGQHRTLEVGIFLSVV